MKTLQNISSVGHPTNGFDDDDFDDNELRESFQIGVTRGDKIRISPHVGRFGIGYSPSRIGKCGDVEANSSQFFRGDENNTANQKLPGISCSTCQQNIPLTIKMVKPHQTSHFSFKQEIFSMKIMRLVVFLLKMRFQVQVEVVLL